MPVGLKTPSKLLPVKGVRLSAVDAGLRYRNRPDLVLLVCEPGSSVSAVFTRNRYVAAPVIVARNHLAAAPAQALLINAGQANAGTGKPGVEVAQASCRALAEVLGCQPDQVLPFSTGVIGAAPPLDKIRQSITNLVATLDEDNWLPAAHGIMTTDIVAKGASRQVELDGVTVTVTGITKGSGMIHPNMATMLAFVATDAAIDQGLLQQCWSEVTENSFNRITVDGDTSTNDAAVVFASGQAGNAKIHDDASIEFQELKQAMEVVCLELAQAIVRDGEGATKFVTIKVSGGRSQEDCRTVALTVAHSPLVKTALFASDANWGRIMAAVGRAPVDVLDIDKVDLHIGDVCVARRGAVADGYTDEQGQAAMSPEEILIRIELNAGDAEATVWTTDLSHDYVRINAEYRS